MNDLIKKLERQLIQAHNPILNEMDWDFNWKDKQSIESAFRLLALECCPELLDLYLWKTGCAHELLLDLSEGEENQIKLSSMGNYAAYSLSRDIMTQNKIMQASYADDDCMYPFIFDGVYEDPILIDLDSSRETYKALFYYSPQVLLSDAPIMIYDSIESWLKTIIQCYEQNIYSVDEKGIFQSKTNLEVQLSRSMNPKSDYWLLDF
ncbi:hypothetical protein [Prevotella histicola]|jgi:hypothetical protein|uniref:hypothetical protein n=2 Tax=Prevotella histicola TaxID=470565 RepID=UPI001CB24C5A|nr:hypothetical protein [Prevotella histicola]MBF1418284.1 hypothetical protein [Prevotella histicola]